MPSRKLTSHCGKCKTKNHLRARFCNNCGAKLKHEDLAYDQDGRAKLYADIAHPVNASCREMIQKRVIEELEKEIELASQPGYKSRYEDDYDVLNKNRRRNSNQRHDHQHKSSAPHSKPEGTNEAVDGTKDDFGKGVFD